MRVLVTGADGFVGRHLCRFLEAQGDAVFALGGRPTSESGAASESGTRRIDILHASDVRSAVEEAKPEGIIHLAGFSSVAKSHQDPGAAFAVNTLGTVHLLAALRDVAPKARAVLVSSGEVYGAVAQGTAASEDFPLLPLSPYAASKLAAEVAGFQFHRGAKLEILCARAFNHLGAGQTPTFVVPSFARQLKAMSRGEAERTLKVGDLTAIRDFSHVLDVVEAYRLLLTRGEPGQAYNVCSGEGRTIRQLLDMLIELADLTGKVTVEVEAARLRPAELPSLVGNPDKLRRLGWKPTRSVRTALSDALNEA